MDRWQVSEIDMGGANWWVGVADVGGPQLRGMGPPGALPGVTDRGRWPRNCRWSRKV